MQVCIKVDDINRWVNEDVKDYINQLQARVDELEAWQDVMQKDVDVAHDAEVELLELREKCKEFEVENQQLRGEEPIPFAWWKDCPGVAQRTMERIIAHDRELEAENERLRYYEIFYLHIRSELLAYPDETFNPVMCKICDKTFEEITGKSEQEIAEQALKGNTNLQDEADAQLRG